jgi:hypothetical protein
MIHHNGREDAPVGIARQPAYAERLRRASVPVLRSCAAAKEEGARSFLMHHCDLRGSRYFLRPLRNLCALCVKPFVGWDS